MKFKLLILLLTLATISCKKENKNSITSTANEITYLVKQGKHCFSATIENNIPNNEKTIIEKDYLNINLNIIDNQVNGQYNFISNEKKVSDGNFTGTITANIVTAIYTFSQNEIIFKEELVFKIEKDQLSLLGGEKIEKNGINIFTDKSKGIYMLQIPKIDCN